MTAKNESTEAQLFGGAQDGKNVYVELVAGLPPPGIARAEGQYILDGCLTDGRLRYSLEGCKFPQSTV